MIIVPCFLMYITNEHHFHPLRLSKIEIAHPVSEHDNHESPIFKVVSFSRINGICIQRFWPKFKPPFKDY